MRVGLRGRITAALIIACAFTLAVTAVVLLLPIERRLRDTTVAGLVTSLRNERGVIAAIPPRELSVGSARLLRAARLLARRNGAEVIVLTRAGRVLVNSDPDGTDVLPTAAAAERTGRTQHLVVGEGREAEAEVSFLVTVGDQRVIVTARKRLNSVYEATRVVQRGIVEAAAAGLAGAALLGLVLAGRLVRRLLRLRDTVVRVGAIGPEVDLRPDSGKDEIGDLSRSFAAMQDQLREQESARRAFVATASHELRTPLTSLSVMLDTLKDDLHDRPPDLGHAQAQALAAEAQVQRLSQLAAELLNLSRIDAGIPMRRELVELSAVLRSVVAELDVRLAEQHRAVKVIGEEVLWAIGDPGAAAQIFRVMLDNALRHTPPDAEIHARTCLREGVAVVAVEDDGPGVAPEDRARIFQRFARGADASEGGFGLGLAIGRELARQMDGDLLLEAGPGGRFTLRLPAAPAP